MSPEGFIDCVIQQLHVNCWPPLALSTRSAHRVEKRATARRPNVHSGRLAMPGRCSVRSVRSPSGS
eukprot:8707472-Alexandrium_andersonii.AAC.1